MSAKYIFCLGIVVVFNLASMPVLAQDGCTMDTQCKGERICSTEGRCVSVPTDVPLEDVTEKEPGRLSSRSPMGSREGRYPSGLHLQMTFVGSETFKMAPTVEFGGKVTGVLVAASPITSIVNGLADLDDSSGLDLPLTLGGGMNWYATGQGKAHGLYLGGLVVLQLDLDTAAPEDVDFSSSILANFGYRFLVARRFTFSVGVKGGIDIETIDSGELSNDISPNVGFVVGIGSFL